MKIFKLNIIILGTAILSLTSCSKTLIIGSGEIITESRTHDGFENIEIEGIFETTIKQGSTYNVEIVGNTNLMQYIYTEVKSNTLEITMEQRQYDNIEIELIITSPELREITKRGVGSTIVEGFYDLDALEINHYGLASFSMEGSVDKLTLNKSGIGSFDAFDLEVKECEIEQNGIGNTRITCDKSLTGELNGIGNIYYKGRPNIKVEVNGIGNIEDAN